MTEQWSEYRREQFRDDLKRLMDTYGIAYLFNITAGTSDGRFEIASGNVYFAASNVNDNRAADDVIRDSLIDTALRTNDKTMFEYVTKRNNMCVDCDADLTHANTVQYCRGCGKRMCATCYRIGRGRCSECDYPHMRRFE